MFRFQRDLTLKGNMRMIRMLWKLSSQLSHLFKGLLLCCQLLSRLFPPPFAFSYFASFSHLPLLSDTLRGRSKQQTPAAWPGATSLARLPTFLPQTANDSHQLLQRISETTPSFSSVFATAEKAAGDACVFPKRWTLFSAEGALRSDRSFHYQNWHLPHSCSLYHFSSEHSHHLLFTNFICFTKSVQPAVTPCF